MFHKIMFRQQPKTQKHLLQSIPMVANIWSQNNKFNYIFKVQNDLPGRLFWGHDLFNQKREEPQKTSILMHISAYIFSQHECLWNSMRMATFVCPFVRTFQNSCIKVIKREVFFEINKLRQCANSSGNMSSNMSCARSKG